MPSPRPRSLKRLLLMHEAALLVLVVVTSLLGGMWAYFWQQSSQESVRINALLFEAQQVRGDLYRQIKDVTRARLMEDPSAISQYWSSLRRIDSHFNSLRQLADKAAERNAIEAMQQTYLVMRQEMNKIFVDPYIISDAARIRLLDPSYEVQMLGDFESAFNEFSRLIAERREELNGTLQRWTQLAAVLIPLIILLGAGLLIFSHWSLQRSFVQPMRELTEGAERMRAGHLGHETPERGVQEVARLAHSFNAMARELAASRNALIESERQAALGALVPVVAHNIRNPLATIRASAQMVDDLDEPEDLREAKQAIIETVDRLERWVSSLLSYLHPLKPHPIRTSLGRVVEGAMAPLKSRLEAKQLQLVRYGWKEDRPLYLDVDLMEQAIYGLLNNAAEASPHGGRISLTLAPENDGMALIIRDQGSGMPFHPQPNDLSPVPSTKRFGTGLGIPFAFKVCHAHGGRITFQRAPAGGTQVRLDLPLGQADGHPEDIPEIMDHERNQTGIQS